VTSGADFVDGACTVDAWPRTRRPLPWLLVAFLAVIFLVPIEAVQMKVSLPFSSGFDRFFVAGIVAVWGLGLIFRREQGIERLRPKWWSVGVAALVVVAVASIAVNVSTITNLGEWDVAEKKVAVLLGLVAVFAIASLTLRVAELRPLAVLIVVLATITALGTIYEARTGNNLFYSTATTALSPLAEVEPPSTDVDPAVNAGRPLITGPTRHPLSVTSLLGMALPFAVVLAALAPGFRRRLLWLLAAGVIVTGALLTQRKSGLVIPVCALLALLVIRPRLLWRLAPYSVAGLVIALIATPGLFSSLGELEREDSRSSVEGRTSDYPAIVPDLLSNPILGRGFGTLDTLRQDTYRIFDNEYLGTLYQTGFLGLIAFIALILTPVVIAVRYAARRENPLRGPPALAAAAGCLGFAVASALYDILTFPQAPYLFLFMAAMCTTAASVEKVAPEAAVRALPRSRGSRQLRRSRGGGPLANPT
jgi:4-amino-4-deoxy-L-arabinose transferase-like glycosyltransferase